MYKDRFTSHYHTHFREYDPIQGRWLSQDPAGYMDGLNLYAAYIGVNGADLLGLAWYNDWGDALWYIGKEGVGTARDITDALVANSYKIAGAYYKGSAQGALNSIQGTQDIVVGLGDLVYQYNTVSVGLKLSGVDIGRLESYDWAKGALGDTSDNIHNLSKIFGGEGVTTLATLGASELLANIRNAKDAKLLKNLDVVDDFADDSARYAQYWDNLAQKTGTLSNRNARAWYLSKEAEIPSLLNKSLPLKQQAEQAFKLRNVFRAYARELMSNREYAAFLARTEPHMSWEQVVAKYSQKFSGDDLWREIIKKASESRTSVNKGLGF